MNREQKRKLTKILKTNLIGNDLSEEDIKKFVEFKDRQSKAVLLKEGEKVKLNYDQLISDANFDNKVEKYKDFIINNKDTIFTVKYDYKYRKNPWLVCLAEDTTEPKWLFTTDDLIKCSVE